jgi:hypothetical protein
MLVKYVTWLDGIASLVRLEPRGRASVLFCFSAIDETARQQKARVIHFLHVAAAIEQVVEHKSVSRQEIF